MAARCYLRAAEVVDDEAAGKLYRKMAESSLSMQTVHSNTTSEISLADIEYKLPNPLIRSVPSIEFLPPVCMNRAALVQLPPMFKSPSTDNAPSPRW